MKKTLTFIMVLFMLPSLQAQYHRDCSSAKTLCSNTAVEFEAFHGRGAVRNEVGPTDCYDGLFPENNGVWIKWTIGTAGELAFTITPKQTGDDLDFVIFRIPDGSYDCGIKEPLRCAVSGENQGQARSTYSICMGATGLRSSSTDFAEKRGCFGADDNFVAPINAQVGESYMLYVNNYASKAGFTLEFTGDADFAPQSEKAIERNTAEAIIVGQEVTFSTPVSSNEEARTYLWDFGDDAMPRMASGKEAQQVSFLRPGTHEITRLDFTGNCLVTTNQSVIVYERSKPGLMQGPTPAKTIISDIQLSNVFPNPSADEAFITVNTPVSQTAVILIADVLGREVSRTQVELVAGQQQLSLDLGRVQQTQNLFVNVKDW